MNRKHCRAKEIILGVCIASGTSYKKLCRELGLSENELDAILDKGEKMVVSEIEPIAKCLNLSLDVFIKFLTIDTNSLDRGNIEDFPNMDTTSDLAIHEGRKLMGYIILMASEDALRGRFPVYNMSVNEIINLYIGIIADKLWGDK